MGDSISMQKVKVITLNVNGIRAAKKKGLFQWIVSQNPDYVCIQEVRAQEKDLELSYFNIDLVDLPLRGTYFFFKETRLCWCGNLFKEKTDKYCCWY